MPAPVPTPPVPVTPRSHPMCPMPAPQSARDVVLVCVPRSSVTPLFTASSHFSDATYRALTPTFVEQLAVHGRAPLPSGPVSDVSREPTDDEVLLFSALKLPLATDPLAEPLVRVDFERHVAPALAGLFDSAAPLLSEAAAAAAAVAQTTTDGTPQPQPATLPDPEYVVGASALQSLQNLFVWREADAMPSAVRFVLNRAALFEQSRQYLLQPVAHLPKELRVGLGDSGTDAGGLRREYFTLLAQEFMRAERGLLTACGDGDARWCLNPDAFRYVTRTERLAEYKMLGRFLALALMYRFVVPLRLARPYYKLLLGRRLRMDDLREMYPDAFDGRVSLVARLDTAGLEALGELEIALGDGYHVDLVPRQRGSVATLTDETRRTYMMRTAQWLTLGRTLPEVLQLRRGFDEVLRKRGNPQSLTAARLEIALCGPEQFDRDEFKRRVEYQEGFHADHPVIRLFWQWFDGLSDADIALVLRFATSSPVMPVQNADWRFKIRMMSRRQLPAAHTCFNQMDLANDYTTAEALGADVMLAARDTLNLGFQIS